MKFRVRVIGGDLIGAREHENINGKFLCLLLCWISEQCGGFETGLNDE